MLANRLNYGDTIGVVGVSNSLALNNRFDDFKKVWAKPTKVGVVSKIILQFFRIFGYFCEDLKLIKNFSLSNLYKKLSILLLGLL